MTLSHRIAVPADHAALQQLAIRAIDRLQVQHLDPDQIRASHGLMGIDTQLLRDSTYFIIEEGRRIAGCGGWSYRRTLFGGDASLVAREPGHLDPATDAARIRAMYTDPDFARRGVGRSILRLCEEAALAHGFRRAEMMATMAGEPLYRACGYARLEEPIDVTEAGVAVPLVRMGKPLRPGHR